MRNTLNLLLIFALLTIVACTDRKHSTPDDKAVDQIYAAIKAQSQERALALTDSLEHAGVITEAHADLLRANAYDFTNKKRLGELFYKKSYDALKEDPSQDWDTYAEAGYRFSALLGMRFDLEGSLVVATEMVKVAEKNKDFPSEYMWSLLMQIAFCQGELHQDKDAINTYYKAYQAACDAYGGEGSGEFNLMVIDGNIFSYLCHQGNYSEAEVWLERCQKELIIYEHNGDSALIEEYKGHMALQQAILLQSTGHSKEAAAIYNAIPRSRIVNPFGIEEALEYLMAAGRYNEAAVCYEQMDSTYVAEDGSHMDFDNITYRLTSRFMANYKAGRSGIALKLGADICQAIDSALVWQKKNDAAELAIIYKTHENEMELEKSRDEALVHRILLISALLIIVLILFLLARSYKYNKALFEKNRRLLADIEQREQEKLQAIEQLQAKSETSLSFNEQLYRRICEVMKNPDVYTDPETNQDTLAGIIGTNRTYIYDAIRECSDQTPSDFINGYRLRYAANLLATTNQSVALVAELCGLSRRTFYRLFNDIYSMSPSDYRQVANKAQSGE